MKRWLATLAVILTSACGTQLNSSPPPQLLNVNAATNAQVAPGSLISINGVDLLTIPGHIDFAQGVNGVSVVPELGAWTDTTVVVRVPLEGALGPFDTPAPVSLAAVTLGGVSNTVNIELLDAPEFEVTDLAWEPSVSLPTPLRGLRAVTARDLSGRGFLFVVGGDDGANNTADVAVNDLGPTGDLTSGWRQSKPLPDARAYHGLAIADPTNALIAPDHAFIYVVGGQTSAGGSPGGTDTVFIGTVSLETGVVEGWAEGPDLPASIVGPAAVVDKGFVYIIAGLSRAGNPADTTFIAEIQPDGTLADWEEAAESLPSGRHFATAFTDGDSLYVMGGDGGSRTDVNDQTEYGSSEIFSAKIQAGVVGEWDAIENLTTRRSKHVQWSAFGKVIVAGGTYAGAVGSLEVEYSLLSSEGMEGWEPAEVTIGANAINAASAVSSVRAAGAAPRLILLGGDTLGAPGVLSDAVWVGPEP